MPTINSHACEWLRTAIAEFHALWAEHQDAIRFDGWMSQPEYREARHSIAEEVNATRANPLIAASQWWQKREQGFNSKTQRLRHLKNLLDCLDEVYSNCRLVPPVAGLLLGRRWWSVAMIRDEIPAMPAPTVGYRYPHLRVVDIREDEWIPQAETKTAFAPVRSGGKLRVGLCCLSGKSRTFFHPTRVLVHEENAVGFLAEKIKCLTNASAQQDTGVVSVDIQYAEELRESVRWARENKVHVLCFPELCVCPHGLATLRNEIEKDSCELCLVIPGSYHVPNNSGSVSNVAPIWLVEHGIVRELPAYEKADPMAIAKAKDEHRKEPEIAGILDVAKFADQHGCGYIKEDIREGNAMRLLYTPAGVVAVTICKDLLFAQLTHLQRLIGVADHILVVSMNEAQNRFWSKTENDICPLGTAVFYVNTPQLVLPTDSQTEIVFWYAPRVKKAAPNKGNGKNKREGTRVCLFRDVPAPRDKVAFEQVSSDGMELCEMDFSDARFFGLMTET